MNRDTSHDLACGTAGFSVIASEYLRQHNGDSIYKTQESRRKFNSSTFHDYDFDSTVPFASEAKFMTTKPIRKPSRSINKKITLFLYTQAGGRCEFDGCNRYLLEHALTETVGNFAEQGHIWAFNEGGPRGKGAGRPSDINGLDNLILLCPQCHKLVDDNPQQYPVEVLKKFKKDHEDRIFDLTGLSKDRDTVPLVLKGLVHGLPVDISDEEMQRAVAPCYIKKRARFTIDLREIPDNPDQNFWDITKKIIDTKMAIFHDANHVSAGRALRVSVFALAPIPLLVYLGSKLSDKLDVELYQRHRDPETWVWKEGSGNTRFKTECLCQGQPGDPVILLVNVSGSNGLESIPQNLAGSKFVYEITLSEQNPSPRCLNTKQDLERFTGEYWDALASIRKHHPEIDVLHVLPAVPAPVAIAMGRSRLPKIPPLLLIYDRDVRAGGFVPTLEIG